MNHIFENFFNFHQKHRVATHILFWFVVYSLGVFATSSSEGQSQLNVQQNIVLHVMMMISKIPIAYWLAYGSIPLFFDKKKYSLAIALFLSIYYLNFCLAVLFKIVVYPRFQMFVVGGVDEFSLKYFIKDYMFSNIGVAASMMLIKLLVNRTEVQRKALLLDKQKTEIELKLLKTQLNPHFLFNTLNNIYSLSLFNSPKTSTSIARLSEILDYILYRCNTKTVPIIGEVQLIENYLELEKLRYDERLRINFIKHIQVNSEIAPLILLTFVENAFKHGASEDSGSPEINIELNTDERKISFCIVNSCITQPKQHKEIELGIGLKNLRQQLELIYQNNHYLEIEQSDNFFEVILTINTPSV